MKSVKLMNRSDTKFVTSTRLLEQLLEMIDDEYFIQVTDGNSIAPYHTLYFDTPDCRMYTIHHNGIKRRQKLRIRSYVDSQLHFLEVKTKDNHGKTKKKRVAVDVDPSTCLTEAFSAPVDNASFLERHLWYDPALMTPQIENSFSRITLVNRLKTERLTIDTRLRYHNLITDARCSLDNIAIIELKRDSLQPSPIIPHLLRLRIFSMGFSKYCMGMALTNPDLKQNRFKERLRLVSKF